MHESCLGRGLPGDAAWRPWRPVVLPTGAVWSVTSVLPRIFLRVVNSWLIFAGRGRYRLTFRVLLQARPHLFQVRRIPPADDPGDVGCTELVLRCAANLRRGLRIGPESKYIEIPAKRRQHFCCGPRLVALEKTGPEMAVPLFIDQGCTLRLEVGWISRASRSARTA